MSRLQLLGWLACLVLSIALAIALAIAAFTSVRFYERSLRAQQMPTLYERGPSSSDLLFLGDSRVSQWSKWDAFDARYLGFPGATSFQVLGVVQSDVTGNICAPIVVIQLGINDTRLLGISPTEIDRVTEATTENLLKVAKKVSTCSGKVILQAIIKPSEPSLLRKLVWSDAIETAVHEINRKMLASDLPSNITVLDVESVFDQNPERFYADTLHFTQFGYEKLNETVGGAINHAF